MTVAGEDPKEQFGWASVQHWNIWRQVKERPGRRPALCSNEPLYGTLSFGEGADTTFLCVFDESGGTGTGHDTLYLDQNNNEDLTDDPKLTGTLREDGRGFRFPAVELRVSYGEKTLPYHIQCQSYGVRAKMGYGYSACYLTGEITLDGDTYSLYLFDDTANGLFNDLFSAAKYRSSTVRIRASGDCLLIDLNKDGKVERGPDLLPEMFALGRYLCIGERCYEITIDPTGRQLDLRPATGDFGYITCDQHAFSAELYDAFGAITLFDSSPGEGNVRIRCPAGDYRFGRCTLQAEDDQGLLWQASGCGTFSQPIVKVQKNKDTHLTFGFPLTVEVKSNRNKDEYRFSTRITGAGGEDYHPNAFRSARAPLPEPRFEAHDAEGKTIVIDDLHHG